MNAQEFKKSHLIPTLKGLYGAKLEGHLTIEDHRYHQVFRVPQIDPNSSAHKQLSALIKQCNVYGALLGDNTYSFVVAR